MRLRQFGGALEHTVFKCLVRFLSPTDEPRVFDRNSGLGGEADNDLLVPCCEPSSLRMPEQKAADYFALSRDAGYGEMASKRRSAERRVGNEGVSKCLYRWLADH